MLARPDKRTRHRPTASRPGAVAVGVPIRLSDHRAPIRPVPWTSSNARGRSRALLLGQLRHCATCAAVRKDGAPTFERFSTTTLSLPPMQPRPSRRAPLPREETNGTVQPVWADRAIQGVDQATQPVASPREHVEGASRPTDSPAPRYEGESASSVPALFGHPLMGAVRRLSDCPRDKPRLAALPDHPLASPKPGKIRRRRKPRGAWSRQP